MNKQALIGTTRSLRTLSDGTVRLQVDIEPMDALSAMQFFGSPNTPVALACLLPEVIVENQREKVAKESAGMAANSLHRIGFFKKIDVARAIGPDKDFLVWVRKQPCVVTGVTREIEAAHVRRVSAGSGTGIKPEYNAIPLYYEVHREQHQSGEFACLQKFKKTTEWTEESARQWFQAKADEMREQWVKSRLYLIFNVSSMKDVDYKEFAQWAQKNQLETHLSQMVRELL